MSSVSELSQFAHDLGIVNIDGVVFRKKVTYYDENGHKLELTEEFLSQECSIKGDLDKKLTNYLSVVAKEHVKKAGKELKDTNLIVINSSEVSIDGEISTGHDFDLSDESQEKLKKNLKEDIRTASKTWELAHDILIQDFDHHISCASAPKLTFTGELDTLVKPHRAELTLERVRDDGTPPVRADLDQDEDTRSLPPSYSELGDDEVKVVPSAPLVTSSLNISHPAVKDAVLTSAPPVDKSRAAPVIPVDKLTSQLLANPSTVGTSPLTPVTVGHVRAVPDTHVVTAPKTVEMPKRRYKSLPELLGELNGKDLKGLQPYLEYFSPFHWESVVELYKGFKTEPERQAFLQKCELLKQETIAFKAQKLQSPIVLATDEKLLEQLSPHERPVFKRVFKKIDEEDKELHTESPGRSHQTELTEEESQREKQIAKAKQVRLAVAHRKEAERLLKEGLDIDQVEAQKLHEEHMRHLESLNAFADGKTKDKQEYKKHTAIPEAIRLHDEQERQIESLNAFANGETADEDDTPVTAADIKMPVIMLYDEKEEDYKVVVENKEILMTTDKDVIARTDAINAHLDDPNDLDLVAARYIAKVFDIYYERQRDYKLGDKSPLDQIIDRYQVHLAQLEVEYRRLAALKRKTFNKDAFIQLKAKLDTEFKVLILTELRNDVQTIAKPSEQDFFTKKAEKSKALFAGSKKVTTCTDEAKQYIGQVKDKYFEVVQRLKSLGTSFESIPEGMLATNGVSRIIEFDKVDTAAKFVVSILDPRHTKIYSEEEHSKAIADAVSAS